MLNQVILVGRVIEKNKETVKISTTRPYKNEYGVYENDYIDVVIPEGSMRDSFSDYCNIGDVIGIRGSLRTNEGGQSYILTEKLTFLSSSNNKKEEDIETIE